MSLILVSLCDWASIDSRMMWLMMWLLESSSLALYRLQSINPILLHIVYSTVCMLHTELKCFYVVFNLVIYIFYCHSHYPPQRIINGGGESTARRGACKNVNRPYEQLDCCLSYKLEEEMTSWSFPLFVDTFCLFFFFK